MKATFMKLAILFVVIFFFTGCAAQKKPVPAKYEKPVVSPEPGNRYYYFTEAQLQKKKGNLDNAIQYLRKSIEIDPESSYLLKELATLYLMEKDTGKALQAVEKILEDNEQDIGALIIYGRIKQSLKHFDDAKNHFQFWIEKNGGNEDNLNDLIEYLKCLGAERYYQDENVLESKF